MSNDRRQVEGREFVSQLLSAEQAQPKQQALGVMMTDMLESVAVLGVMKPLILDFPTALGSVIRTRLLALDALNP